MTSRSKKLTLVLLAVALIAGAELVREQVLYLRDSRALQHSYWRIKPGMDRATVVSALGEPSATTKGDNGEESTWSASRYQRFFFRHFGARTGHYIMTVSFDKNGQVTDVSSGVS